ncbi:MAG TPA: U32 family peptidase C-terminal domain-containing protein, partial [Candidatus Gracilibacteria bacterium]|nr:U32 family peptidase C-terminal domain-containing protein [Candidatus Gracilibacteria bacterium]
FDKKSFLENIKWVRAQAKKNKREIKIYITVNIFPRNNKVESFKKYMEFLRDEVKPDALIIADPGVIDIAKEVYPEAVLHLSVQANTLNYRAVEFWKKQGIVRVILPRELMLEEIAEIHAKVPDIELEVFVHGAICMAYSGRCLLSAYMTGRDANQGICAHSCRWKYKMYLEEEERPGEFMPIEEHDEGTYIMNSRDNCAIEYLKQLWDAGITSFKIEGRNKTIYYLAVVSKAYRKAIDDMVAGRKFDKELLIELNKISNRGYIPGFLKGFPGKDNVKFDKNSSESAFKFLGIVREIKGSGANCLCRVEVRNRFEIGDEVEIITPCENKFTKVKAIFNLKNEPVEVAHGGDKDVWVNIGKGIDAGWLLRKKA